MGLLVQQPQLCKADSQQMCGLAGKEAEADLLLGSLSLKGFHLALPLDLQHLGLTVCALQLFLNNAQSSVSA